MRTLREARERFLILIFTFDAVLKIPKRWIAKKIADIRIEQKPWTTASVRKFKFPKKKLIYAYNPFKLFY